MPKKGTIFVVATPIGNLKDITFRAIEVLKTVDLILSEDTRETKKILDKFEISTDQLSYRDENHTRIKDKIFDLINTGSDVALVSDSGTPLISDPGFKLIEEARNQDINVTAIPGPSAIISALSISGLPTDKFAFLGFLPRKTGQIETILKKYGTLDATLVIYESPFRVNKLLATISDVLGNRYVCTCNEMTKMFEETCRGEVEVIKNTKLKEKGEYVVLVAKEGYRPDAS